MSFMTAYWATTVVFLILTVVSVVIESETPRGSMKEFIWQIARWVFAVIVVVLVFAGIWLPFFIPGLY